MSKKSKSLKQKLDVIFSQGGKSKHRHRAVQDVEEMIFAPDIDSARRREIIQCLLLSLTSLYSKTDTQGVFNQVTKLFRHLAICSLEKGDFNLLRVTWVLVDDFPGAKRTIYQIASAVYLQVVGSTYEQTKRFCRSLFEKIKEVVVQCAPLTPEQVPASTTDFLSFLTRLVTQSFIAPCDGQYAQKQWLTNLIDGYQKDDQEACCWLTGLLEFICEGQRDLTVIIPKTDADSGPMLPFNFQAPHIVLPEQSAQLLRSFIIQDTERRKAIGETAGEFKNWYFAKRDAILELLKLKSEDIINNPSYALLPDGSDRVEIGLSALYNVGIRAIAFYPGGLFFPNVKLRITVCKDMRVTCDFWGSLENLTFVGGDYIFDNFTEPDFGYLREVFTYVVIDALHTIVVGERQRKRNDSGKIKFSVIVPDKPNFRRMRARIRNLAENTNASPNAIKLASDHGWTLPPGKTFQKEHDRPSVYQKSDIAVQIKYTDQMCMNGLPT